MPLFESIEEFQNVSPVLQWAIFIVACMIAVVAAVAICISLWLFIKYIKFNRTKNSANLTGGEAARKILDANGLNHIKVSTFGSIIFGNSYSHYFNVRYERTGHLFQDRYKCENIDSERYYLTVLRYILRSSS